MVPEKPLDNAAKHERLRHAQHLARLKRKRAAAASEPAASSSNAASAPTQGASSPMGAAAGEAASPLASSAAAPGLLPLQAREVEAPEQPRAHTTCKRCAAAIDADAAECWNCGLRFPQS